MSQEARFCTRVISSIQSSIKVKSALLNDRNLILSVSRASECCARALKDGGKLLLFGNGGSAADAQHVAAEFIGRFALDRPALPALSLAVNPSCVTAIGNDFGFDRIFSRQLEALGRRGDVAVGFSTSGNSANVLIGIGAAKRLGLHTIALTGGTGGKLKGSPDIDVCICAPSDEVPRIQECHILIGHIISELVEEELFRG